MADPRKWLRPLVHSGVPAKVNGALDEIVRRGEPALVDWLLGVATVEPLARSAHWRWKYDDTVGVCHPSLEPAQALRLVAGGTSALAAKLRKRLGTLGLELVPEHAAFLDVAMLGGLTETRKLRLLAKDPESSYEWRAELAATPAKPVTGIDMLAGMTALEHLTIIGGRISVAPLGALPALAHLELAACELEDPAALGDLGVTTLKLYACSGITALDALPPRLEHLVVEDLATLRSLAGLARARHLATVEVAGVPLDALPTLGEQTVKVTFQRERPPRTTF